MADGRVARAAMILLVLTLIVGRGVDAAATRPMPQIDPAVRNAAVMAAVQVAAIVVGTEDGAAWEEPVPIGSGTVVSPNGLVLTNAHVVDLGDLIAEVAAAEAELVADGVAAELRVDEGRFLLLTSDGVRAPVPRYEAVVAARDAALDLAVLQITADAEGRALAPADLDLPFVPLAAGAVGLGDPVHVFGYPGIAGESLTYTAGVVSGFAAEAGVPDPAWIASDATISGGSSGGAAVNAAGELVGVPTLASELDCRPGDTNRDGVADAADVGCVPVGGSLARLRPAALAEPLLRRVDPLFDASFGVPSPSPTSARSPWDFLPPEDAVPGGLVTFIEFDNPAWRGGIEDSEEGWALLGAWGWDGFAFRTFQTAKGTTTENGITGLSVTVYRFADAAATAEALAYLPDYDIATNRYEFEEVDGAAVGDGARWLRAEVPAGTSVLLYFQAGRLLVQVAALSPNGDPTPDIAAVAGRMLSGAAGTGTDGARLWGLMPAHSEVPSSLDPGGRGSLNGGNNGRTGMVDAFGGGETGAARLEEWGWQETINRSYYAPSDAPARETALLHVEVLRFAREEGASAALAYLVEQSGLPKVMAGPLGDEARMFAGRQGANNVAEVYCRVGPTLFKVTAFSAAGYPRHDALAVAEAIVSRGSSTNSTSDPPG